MQRVSREQDHESNRSPEPSAMMSPADRLMMAVALRQYVGDTSTWILHDAHHLGAACELESLGDGARWFDAPAQAETKYRRCPDCFGS